MIYQGLLPGKLSKKDQARFGSDAELGAMQNDGRTARR
jgi:hypothetical protein